MADIKDVTVLPRPRSAWQAMDAGFTLARAHYITLVILWLGFSLPVFIVCALLQLWLGWSIMLFVWWWFKPLYELPMHLFLSKALFSEHLSITDAWKMAVSNAGKLFATYLTIARLSTARAMTYGVVFLERLPRKQRSTRIQTLTMVPTRHYLLMLVCLHIEYILAYAIITTVAVLFFSNSMAEFDWSTTLIVLESPELQPWLVAASLTTLIAAALVAPFYVTGGFIIYINRRMQLEAWDIEHRFRSIKSTGRASVASAVLLVLCLGSSDPTIAEQRASALLSPVEASETIEDILSEDDFGYTKKQWVPKFDFSNDRNESDFDADFFDFLTGGSATTFATVVKALLWIAIALFVGLLLFTLRGFRRPQIQRSALARSGRDGEDATNHPLTQNLPTDIAAAAEQLLKQGKRREALSVLFRGALRAVMSEYDLKVSRGATESDCKQTVSSVGSKQQANTFAQLLGVWQKEAYANEPQQVQVISLLIDDWKSAFDIDTKKHSAESEQQS